MRSIVILSLLFLCVCWGDEPPKRNVVITQPSADETPATALLGLRSLTWDEAQPIIRTMLTEDGTIGYLSARNAIIVRDQQKVVTSIRDFLDAADRDPVNIQIKVEFLGDVLRSSGRLGVSINSEREGPRIIVRDGRLKPFESVRVEVEKNKTTEIRDNVMHVMVRSGAAAKLWVGETVPDPEWLRQRKLTPFQVVFTRHGTVAVVSDPPPVTWRNVGSALYVRPTYQENGLVHIELFPVVTYLDGEGHEKQFQVQEVRTEVHAKPGQRIYIGGADQHWNQFTTQVFGPTVRENRDKTSGVAMYLTPNVRIMRPPVRQ